MGFLEVFSTEREQRSIYGVSTSYNAIKVFILSYLLLRVFDPETRHKLILLYEKYNRGLSIISLGASINPSIYTAGEYLTETISRVIRIESASLSGTGTIEEQIAEYINANNITKQGTDAEFWVEII